MKKGKQLAVVVLYGITAAIWLIHCLRDIAATGQADGLQVLVAAVWSFGFVVLLRRYLHQR